MYLDVRKNFEEKVSYVARRISDMTVDDQTGSCPLIAACRVIRLTWLWSEIGPLRPRCWRALTVL
jgi:hypothetical protein